MSLLDALILQFDQGLRTVFTQQPCGTRPNPADSVSQPQPLTDEQRQLATRLLRINEAGEVSAQALYQGQALVARDPQLKQTLLTAADEENDHLAWCQARLNALDSHTSYLNPIWYVGSFCLGAVAGLIGDKWSLGFLAETEEQVVRHLDDHLQRLPENDEQSRRVLKQMREDELHHADTAHHAGAAQLPGSIKTIMHWMSRVMTSSAYWL